MQPSHAATQRVREWARVALQFEAGVSASPIATFVGSTNHALAAIQRQRLVELLDTHAVGLGLPEEISAPLSATRARTRRAVMVQMLELAAIGELLSDEGIDWMALKGPTLAMQSAGDPSARGCGDIDLLVAPESVEAAYLLLIRSGWVVRPVGSARPDSWAWRHILSTFNEMTFDGRHSTVDLHWRLDPTHGALPGFAEVWGRRSTVDVGGTKVETLGIADSFSHACHHAAKDDWRWLRSLVDVHRLARLQDFSGGIARIDVTSLAATEVCIGLPATIPDDVKRQVAASVERSGRKAIAAQDRPVFAEFPFPAAQSIRDLRYRVRASRSPSDLERTAVAAIIPAKAVAELDDRSAWTAIPRVFARRVAWLLRRTVGWMRRSPGASVVQRTSEHR